MGSTAVDVAGDAQLVQPLVRPDDVERGEFASLQGARSQLAEQ